jgi:poly-gamma-glutamate capsule biosynthesis protein CapA/YwtB (metallophosphatase superfamily)
MLFAAMTGCAESDNPILREFARRVFSPQAVVDAFSDRPKPPPEEITIVWAGDTVMGSSYGLPPNEGRDTFNSVRNQLVSADLTMVNLEGTFSVDGISKCAGAKKDGNCFAFQAPPTLAAPLAKAGIDLVNLANNHTFDFGENGRQQTLATLRKFKIKRTGAPGQITFIRIGSRKVAVLGFAPDQGTASLLDIPAAQSLVKRAAKHADILIVLMHAGAEGSGEHHTPEGVEVAFDQYRGDTRGFAHGVIDAGADLVLGSGPHVVRGIERYRERLIAYSTGNFVGYGAFNMTGTSALSGILRLSLSEKGCVTKGRWVSVRLVEPGIPTIDTTHESARLVSSLSTEDFQRTYPMDNRGRLTARTC